MQYNFGQMHVRKLLNCSYTFLIAAGRIDSRSALRHLQDGGCLFPMMQLFLGRGRFTHKVPGFILHKACWEPKQDEASPFPKKQMPKKKQMMGAIQGAESDKEVSSINQRWPRLEVITQRDARGRSWKGEIQHPAKC